MSTTLTDPLRLPCGATIANRIAKAAITEGLADANGSPTPELERLYRGWAGGGFGLMITGNIIVNGDHLERPGNVIVDQEPSSEQMARLRSWTHAATQHGGHLWAQLSHSGRQTPKAVNPCPLSPSAVRIGLPGGLFGKPQTMTQLEIAKVVFQFAAAARICKAAGFTGVQIHAAHGYLISSFLSPKTNLRTDQWGGALENRSLVLMAIVAAVREEVGPDFPIGVKLNSADFQKGGFGAEESELVALKLEAAGVDLLEISGGSYESPAMVGQNASGDDYVAPPKKASTVAREAYFLDFARALRRRLKMPIMLTGGVRTRHGMEAALAEGVDMVGVARPVCVDLECVIRLLAGSVDSLDLWEERLRRDKGFLSSNSPVALIRTLTSFARIYWFYAQLYRHGRGEEAATGLWPMKAMFEVMTTEKRIQARRVRLKKSAARAGNNYQSFPKPSAA
jgi:2,4-dienoyl-CoA reductase-like NADH-dependent reductase (Old Yellow Enzyme family)